MKHHSSVAVASSPRSRQRNLAMAWHVRIPPVKHHSSVAVASSPRSRRSRSACPSSRRAAAVSRRCSGAAACQRRSRQPCSSTPTPPRRRRRSHPRDDPRRPRPRPPPPPMMRTTRRLPPSRPPRSRCSRTERGIAPRKTPACARRTRCAASSAPHSPRCGARCAGASREFLVLGAARAREISFLFRPPASSSLVVLGLSNTGLAHRPPWANFSWGSPLATPLAVGSCGMAPGWQTQEAQDDKSRVATQGGVARGSSLCALGVHPWGLLLRAHTTPGCNPGSGFSFSRF